jgi:hypothetical protein
MRTGDHDGNLRLHRNGPADRILDAVVPTFERDRLPGEQRLHDPAALVERLEPLTHGEERNAETRVLGLEPARADAENRATARDVIHGRHHLRQHAGIAVRVAVDEMPYAHAGRLFGERGQRRPGLETWAARIRKNRVEMVVGPQRVVAPRLRFAPDLFELRPRDVLLAGLDPESDGVFRHVVF